MVFVAWWRVLYTHSLFSLCSRHCYFVSHKIFHSSVSIPFHILSIFSLSLLFFYSIFWLSIFSFPSPTGCNKNMGKKSHTHRQTNKINDDHQNIRRLFACLPRWPHNAWMYLRNLFFFGGGRESRQRWKSCERKSGNCGAIPPNAPYKQQLDIEPDKYKRITSRKIIVIAFLLLFSMFVVAAVARSCSILILHWLSSKFGWVVNSAMMFDSDTYIYILFTLPQPFLSKERGKSFQQKKIK